MWEFLGQPTALASGHIETTTAAGAGADIELTHSEQWDSAKPLPSLPTRRQGRKNARFRVNGPRRDGWYVAKIVLRSFSLCIAIAMVIATHVLYTQGRAVVSVYSRWYIKWPLIEISVYLLGGCVILWDTCELVTVCCRRGSGIPPKAHISLDLTLSLLGSGAMATIIVCTWVKGIVGGGAEAENVLSLAATLTVAGTDSVLHATLFVRNCIDRRKGRDITPRIMYLSTGEPVVVVPRPYPPSPTREVDLERMASPSPTPTLTESSNARTETAVITTTARATAITTNTPLASAAPSTTGRERGAQSPQLPSPTAGPSSASRPAIRRKPVPIVGTPYAEPWAAPSEDYEPGLEERLRAQRGERQAQWMSLHGIKQGLDAKSAAEGGPSSSSRRISI